MSRSAGFLPVALPRSDIRCWLLEPHHPKTACPDI